MIDVEAKEYEGLFVAGARAVGKYEETEDFTLSNTQAIAHRGDHRRFPENSILAFEGAVNTGAEAIETDLHLSKDGVVMISHDATTKRCFGVDRKIIDCDSQYLKTLRTLKAPYVSMPTLEEVLKYFCEPAVKHMWLLLDIKMDNDPNQVMTAIAATVHKVNSGGVSFWGRRIVLGCWAPSFIPLCEKYLPGFPIVCQGASIDHAKEFLKYENVGFNMLWPVMTSNRGKKFMEHIKDMGRDLFVWTINNQSTMKWAIQTKEIDGICTDDPVKFIKLRKEYGKTWAGGAQPKISRLYAAFWRSIAALYASWFFTLVLLRTRMEIEK